MLTRAIGAARRQRWETRNAAAVLNCVGGTRQRGWKICLGPIGLTDSCLSGGRGPVRSHFRNNNNAPKPTGPSFQELSVWRANNRPAVPGRRKASLVISSAMVSFGIAITPILSNNYAISSQQSWGACACAWIQPA